MRIGLAIFSLLLVSSSLAVAQLQSFALDPRKTTIAVTLGASPRAVHRTFRATRGNILFDPASGTSSGSIVVDATSGDTGNSTQDHKMHKQVLESDVLAARLEFQIPYVAWGTRNPSTFVLRVSKEVDMDAVAVGRFEKQPN